MTVNWQNKGQRLINLFFTLSPLVILVILVFLYGVNVPYWDQWEFVLLLEKSYQGRFTFSDLLAQHNEHRLFISRIIMLIIAHISGWNISWELMINIILATGIFIAITYQFKKTLQSIGSCRLDWLAAVISLVVFSLTQWENWLWGWQIQIFLNVFLVNVSIVFLSQENFSWLNILIAAVLTTIASYSFVNGILFWPIGLLILSFASPNRKKMKKWLTILFWLIIGSITVCFYFNNYQLINDQYSFWYSITHPFSYLIYVLSYLGSPVISFNTWGAVFSGIVGISLFYYLIKLLLQKRQIRIHYLIPYIALGFYSIGSAIFTGLGRAYFGSIQAISSRYVTFSNLLWISDIFFLYILMKYKRFPAKSIQNNSQRERKMAFSFLLVITFLIGFNSALRILKFPKQYSYLQPAREALLTGTDNNYLKRLYYSDKVVKERSEILKELNLSVFRENDR